MPGPCPSPSLRDPSHHSGHRGASGPPPASPPSLTLAVPCPLAALSGAQFPRGARGPGDVEWWGQDSGQLPARRHTGQLPGLADSRAGGPAGARQRAAHHVSELGGGGPQRPWGAGAWGAGFGALLSGGHCSASSGVDFTGTTVGLAKVSTMCSQNSGAVNQVRGSARVRWTEAVAGRVGRGGGGRSRGLGLDAEHVGGAGHSGPRLRPVLRPGRLNGTDAVTVICNNIIVYLLFEEAMLAGVPPSLSASLGRTVGEEQAVRWGIRPGEQPQPARPPCRTTARIPSAWRAPWPMRWATTWAWTTTRTSPAATARCHGRVAAV